MTPDQLRRAADLLTARLRGPSPEQPPSEYYLSHAIYALADAMRQIAEEETKVKVRKVRQLSQDAIRFTCPGCNDWHVIHLGAIGWTWNGSFDAPTFDPSVLVQGPVGGQADGRCHSFVRDGRIEFLSDCTHALAGQTVDLPDDESSELRALRDRVAGWDSQ